MNLFVVTLLLATGLASSLRLSGGVINSKSNSDLNKVSTDEPLAHIYVMNLNQRRDRCECMRSQLTKLSPYPAFRQEAASLENLPEFCPDVHARTIPKGPKLKEKPQNREARSWEMIFCANRKAIEQALQNPKKPKYTIIMEDDVAIAPTFFTELDNMLKNQCFEQGKWDVMAIDTFKTFEDPLRRQEMILQDVSKSKFQGCQVKDVKKSNKYWYGAHVQVIKTSKLEQLVQRKIHAMDAWDLFTNETTVFWQPRLAMQVRKHNGIAEAPAECDDSVRQNNHKMHFGKFKQILKQSEGPDDEVDMFACPSM